MGCNNCSCNSCSNDQSVTRQIKVGTYNGGTGGAGSLDDVAHIGNETDLPLIAAPAILDVHLATLAQVKQYSNGGGFSYIDADDLNHIEIYNSIMYKSVISSDVTVGAILSPAGTKGTLIIVQDDLGGHLTSLAPNNKGTSIVLNTLPRAVTELTFIKTDNDAYWTSRVLDPGIQITQVPVFRIDDLYDTLEILHSFNDSDILISTNDGPYVEYTGPFSIGAVDRPAGYWKTKVKATPNRMESAVANSLATSSIKKGFDYTFNFNLS